MTDTREGVFVIPAAIRKSMIEHAIAELPNEACGVLAGNGRIEQLFTMRNADESPMTYRLDPGEQFRVFNQIQEKGWELQGIFHSHTHTQAYPSETDRRQAFYPEATYILLSLMDRANPVVRAFTILDGEIEEQEVRFE